jgi:preprotein translocase subunit YajC
MGGIIFIVVMLVAMWALLVLPQQRRMRTHAALVSALEEGDEVMTSAGIYGNVAAIEGDVVWVEVAPGVELKLAKGAIARRLTGTAEASSVADEEDLDDDYEDGYDDEYDEDEQVELVDERARASEREGKPAAADLVDGDE